jgi:hypothetical protein
VEGVASSFAEANAILLKQYNLPARQNRVKKHLDRLRVAEIASTERISITAALEKVRAEIAEKSGQGPPTHRDESHKCEYLHRSVVGLPWATDVLGRSQSAETPWDFSGVILGTGRCLPSTSRGTGCSPE